MSRKTTFLKALLAFIEQRSKASLWMIVILALLILSVIDYFSGIELSFAIFYLVPTSLAAWGMGRGSGFLFSLVSAVVWLSVNQLAGEQLSHPLMLYWNAFTRFSFFSIVSALIAELHQLLNAERRLARTDTLTDLLNRRAFYDAVMLETYRARRFHHPFSLLYIDLDNFKAINDQLGHSVGDSLLSTVANRMVDCLRKMDLVARLGGDEFAVLLPETDQAAVKILASRLQQFLFEEMQQHHWPVTFSIGALTCHNPPHSFEELLQAADSLMYEAKTAGKNAIAFSDFQSPDIPVFMMKPATSPER